MTRHDDETAPPWLDAADLVIAIGLVAMLAYIALTADWTAAFFNR